MTKSQRFKPIQALASSSAEALSRAMADAGRKVAELERQLAQLESYRDEYVRNAAPQGGAMDAVKMQNYRMFLERLGDAMRQQTRNLETARADHERRRQQWSEKRVEAESLGRAVARFHAEEQRASERREQRESDDAAMRMTLGDHLGSGNR